jgi:hypothetical protein
MAVGHDPSGRLPRGVELARREFDAVSRKALSRLAPCVAAMGAGVVILPAPECWYFLTVSAIVGALVSVILGLANREKVWGPSLTRWDEAAAFLELMSLAQVFLG